MDLIEVLEVLDTSKICRTCLSVSDSLYSVYSLFEDSKDFSYFNLIQSISRTSSESSFPSLICLDCKEFLGAVYEFKKKSETSFSILNKNQEEKYVTSLSVDQESQTEVANIYACEQCEDKFLDHDMLKLHRESEHGSENYKCKKCDKLYTRLGYLQQHIAVSHPESGQEAPLINYCELCNKQFSRKDHLKTHKKNVHKIDFKAEDNYAAEEICDNAILNATDEFVESLNLNLTSGAEDEEDAFNNDDVNEILYTNLQVKDEPSTRNELEESFDIDFDEDEEDEKPLIKKSDVVIKQERLDFSCTKCEKSFVSKDLLDAHAKKHEKKTKAGSSKTKNHQCTKCDKKFTRSNHLKRHALTHGLIKPFKCSSCEKGFTRLDHLNLHVLNHHTTSKPFECDFEGCKKGFMRIEHLQKHKDTRHSAIPIKKEFCSICKKGFSTAKYLQVHMKIHSGERTFPCKFCSEAFTDKTSLTDHTTAQHANEKPYLCCECGLRFVRNDYLVIHQRRHQGIKPYKCSFCPKTFPRKTDLSVHTRYHLNEKSHVCDQCGKAFQRAYNLVVHLRIHSGEKPYQCPHCVKAFAQGNDLKSHIRRHTGERFRCDLCPEGFIQGYHLTHHKRIVHGLDVQSHIRRVEKFVMPSGEETPDKTWSIKPTASTIGKKEEMEQIHDIKMEQYSMPESLIHIEETSEMIETSDPSTIQIIFAPQT